MLSREERNPTRPPTVRLSEELIISTVSSGTRHPQTRHFELVVLNITRPVSEILCHGLSACSAAIVHEGLQAALLTRSQVPASQ